MRNNSTFLHYFKNLVIVAAAMLLPGNAIAQVEKDLTNSLEGWHLLWGSFNSNGGSYDWTRCGSSATGGSGAEGVEKTGSSFMPDIDAWKTANRNDAAWPNVAGGGYEVCAPRFYINGISGSGKLYDPVYNPQNGLQQSYCFYTVPDGYSNSFRLGSISSTAVGHCFAAEYGDVADSKNKYNGTKLVPSGAYKTYTSAEGAYYDLYVTADNSLLTINYVYVASDPDCGNTHSSSKNATAPSFEMMVLYPEQEGEKTVYKDANHLTCGTDAISSCKMSGSAEYFYKRDWNQNNFFYKGFVHSPWKIAIYDLHKYIGQTVRIKFLNHDCIYNGENPGGHSGYLYFTARTSPVKLNVKYCKTNEPIRVEAPVGFSTYNWYGVSKSGTATPITAADLVNGNVLEAEDDSRINQYEKLRVVMHINGLDEKCDVTLDTVIAAANLKATIKPTLDCKMMVNLTDDTYFAVKGDSASVRTWCILNKKYGKNASITDLENKFSNKTMVLGTNQDYIKHSSDAKTVSQKLDADGQWVRLYVENINGCPSVTYMFIVPNPEPVWKTESVRVCEGSDVNLIFSSDATYNALTRNDVVSETYYGSQYSNLSTDLSFEIKKKDGTVVEAEHVGLPANMGPGSTSEQHFDYVVTDRWGCKATGVYDVVVDPQPILRLNPDLKPSKVDGNDIFYICPGKTVEVGAYSTNANNFHWNTDVADSEAAKTSAGNNYSSKKQLGFGKYRITVTDNTPNHCSAELDFNVDYKPDAVGLVLPEKVCPFENATVSLTNAKGIPVWWEEQAGKAGTKVTTGSGMTYNIPRPNGTSTYYCEATGLNGCDYNHSFTLDVTPTINSTFTFQNMVSGTTIAPSNVTAVNEHHYRLPKMCNSDELAITAISPEFTAKHAWKTNFDTDFTEATSTSPSMTKGGFVPRANQDLTIIWRTIPINGANEELCVVYDTITVMGYPQIETKVTVNGQTSNYHVCDKADAKLSVTPNFYTQNPDRTKFTIQWTDANGGYTDDAVKFDETVVADINNAISSDNGKVYTYKYRVTSNEGGCYADFTVPVYINPLPSFELSAEPENLCLGNTVTVTATDNASGSYIANNNPTVTSWIFPSNTNLNQTMNRNAASNSVVYSNITSKQTLTVQGSSNFGCKTSKTIDVNTAAVPNIKVSLRNAFGETVTSVCSASDYQLVVLDQNNSEYSKSDCTGEQWVTVTRKSAPYKEISWQERDNGEIVTTNNKILKHVYDISGTTFGSYTARKVSSQTTEYFDITITSPCGCVTTLTDYEVTVNPAPVVNISKAQDGKTFTKDFMCPNDVLDLTATTDEEDTNHKFKYYWTISSESIQTGNTEGSTGGSNGDATKRIQWTDEAGSFYYTAQVYNGSCYGSKEIVIYNQVAPSFTVDASPDVMCQNGTTKVELEGKALNNTPVSEYYQYYLKSSSNGYSTSSAWTDNKRTIENVKSAVDATGKMYVRAGVAQLVGSSTIRVNDNNYYCYSEIEVPIDVIVNPEVNAIVKHIVDGNDVVLAAGAKICPNEDYSLTVSNTKAVGNDKYNIIIKNLDDETVTETKIVTGNRSAVFTGLRSSSDRPSERWSVQIVPVGATTCETSTTVTIPVSDFPIVRIDQEGGRMYGEDTVLFCVNYYALAQSNSATNKSSVRYNGVDLTAAVENEDYELSTYKFKWTKDGKTTDIADPTLQTINGSVVATPTASSYNHDALYVVEVEDKYHCKGTERIFVRAQDAPRPFSSGWTDAPGNNGHTVLFYNACKNSQTSLWVYEEQRNIRISNATIPHYEYAAYDLNDSQYSLDDYNKYGYEIKENTIPTVDPGFSNWSTYRNSSYNTLKKNGVVVPDSVSYYTLRKEVRFDIGEADQYRYMVSVTDETGCTGYQTINYNPHEYVDLNAFNFKVAVNTGGTDNPDKMADFKTAGSLDPLGNDTVAYICPGDYIVIKFADLTAYNSKFKQNHPWNFNDNYRVGVEFANVATPYSGWVTANTLSDAYAFNTGRTINGPQRMRFVLQKNSDGHGTCTVYSNWFWVSIADSPKLVAFGDNACRLGQDGTEDGVIKLRASSSAPAGSVHKYQWIASDKQTVLENGGNITIKDMVDEFGVTQKGALLEYKTNYRKEDFGTGSNRSIVFYLRDEVEGFCRSADLTLTRYVYNNPEFDITIPDGRDYVCNGEEVTFRVTQDYNWTRCGWQYYYNTDENVTTYDCSMYNDQVNRTSCSSPTTFPHYYEKSYQVTKPNDMINVTSFWNTGSTMTYELKAGQSVNLYCYTHKSYPIHALENPDPYVRLFATEDAGNYHKDDAIISVSKTAPDSVGDRVVCPETEYYRTFSNANPDNLTGYQQTQTTYYIKNVTQGTEYETYTRTSNQTITDKAGYTASSDYYQMYAETDNGCKSEPIQFRIPLGKNPSVEIRHTKDGVCADSHDNSIELTAVATNQPKTYKWYVNDINPLNIQKDASLNPITGGNITVYPVGETPTPYHKDEVKYFVEVVNESGCEASASTTVNIIPVPQFDLSLETETPCKNSQVQLKMQKSASETNYADDLFSYQWTADKSPIVVTKDPYTTKKLDVGDGKTFSVTATVTNGNVSCSTTESINVTTNGIPQPSVAIFADEKSGLYEANDQIASGAKLCPGTKYHFEFTNNAPSSSCDPDRFELRKAGSTDVETFTTPAGTPYKSQSLTLDASVNYQYRLVSGCGCESEWKSFSLDLTPNPTIVIEGPNKVSGQSVSLYCEGTDQNMTLTASAGSAKIKSWKWSPIVTLDEKTQSQTFKPTQDKDFVVTGVTDYGCSATGSYSIKAQKRPNLVADKDKVTVCEGSSVELGVSNTDEQVNASIVQWTSSNGQTWTTTDGNTSKITPTVGANTTFNVYAVADNDLKCPSKEIQISVIAASTPEVLVELYSNGFKFDPTTKALCPGKQFYPVFKNKTGNPAICGTDEFEYWESNSTAEHYKSTVSAGTQANTNGAYKFTMGQNSSNYQYRVKSSCGCQSTIGSFTVAVAPIPEVSISGADSYCDNTTPTIDLTAQSAATITKWLWSANVTTETDADKQAADRAKDKVSVTPNAKSTTYTLVGTSSDGCESKPASHTIVQKEVPTINFNGNDEYVCLGSVADVKANITIPDNTSLLSTVWTPTDAPKSDDDEVTYVINGSTEFKVTVNTENGCQVVSDPFTVKPYKEPSGTVTIKTLTAFGKFAANEELANGTSVCAGTSFYPTFINTAYANEDYSCENDIVLLTCKTTGETFELISKSGTVINNGNERKSFVMKDQDLNFTYQFKTSCGCYGPKRNFSIKLAAAPTVRIVASKTDFCEGSTDKITLTATAGSSLDPNMSWTWTSCPTEKANDKVQEFTPTSSSTYIVTGKSTDGCAGEADVTINKLDVPVPVLSSDAPGNKVCYGTRVNLTLTNNNENNAPLSNVSWTSDLGHSLSGVTVPFTSNATAEFTAVATAQNGCSVTSEPITITTASAPKPEVKIYRLDGTQILNSKLCPGEEYYPVFQNTTGSSTCDNDVYTITSADGVEKYSVTATGGGLANQGGSIFKLQMGESAQSYNYSVKTSCGCESATNSFMVGVAQIPTVTISGSEDYCSNTTPNITLTANSSADIAVYEWSTLVPETQRGEKAVVVTPVGTQEFSVRVKSTDGCWSTEEAHHTITAKPTPLAVLDAESEVCLGSKVGVKANITLAEGTTLNNTVWSPTNGITKIQDDSITATINAATNFTVTVNASNGCSYTSNAITVKPINHPVANVELRYADGAKAGTTFDPATAELCLGSKFYPVFTNSVTTATCTIDTFILRSGDIVDRFPVAAGSKANDNAAKTYTVNGATTYFYTVKTSCGCESDAIKSYSIKVATSPTITIIANGLKGANGNQYCEGDYKDVKLTANSSVANTTYVWDSPISSDDDANLQTTVTVKTGTTTYKVTGTSPSGCKADATFTMEELPKPTVTITGDAQVCAGGKATLTASSSDGNSFLWSYNALTSKTINPEVISTKSFSVVSYSEMGCESAPYEFEVVALPRPNITFEYTGIDNTSNVCDGDVISITANAQNSNATFKWYSDAARTNELQLGDYVTEINGATITVKPITNSPTNYYVTADLEGCQSKDNAQVKAYTLPKFDVIGKTTYCEGQDLSLAIASPANKVKYFWDGNITSSENFKLQNVNKGVTNVIVIAEDANTCRFERNIPITVNTAPVVTVDPSSASICPNGSVELTANGADSYTWTESGKNTTVLGRSSTFKAINLTENIVYRVLGLNTNTQCYDSAFVAVSVKNAPSLKLTSPTDAEGNVNICNGSTGLLTVMGADTYTWTTPVESSTGGSAVIKPTYSREYHVIGENDGCSSELVIPVKVVASPTVTLNSSAVGVCSGNEVTLVATVNGSNNVVSGMTYSWSDDPKEQTNVHTTTLTSDQTFTLTVQQGNSGCMTQVEKTVKAYPIPSAEIMSDLRTVCRDSIVKLTAVANGGTPNYTYKWTRSESANTYSSESITPNVRTESEEFYLTVVDAHLCESEANPVTIFTQAKRELKNLAPEYFCEGERDSFRVNMQGATEYTYGGSGIWTSKNDSVFYRATAGEYSVPVIGRVPLDGATGRYCQTDLKYVVANIVAAPKVEMHLDGVQGDGVCSGTDITLTVNAKNINTSGGSLSFSWEGDRTGNKTNTYTEEKLIEPRTFRCTVTDVNSQCASTASKFVDVYETPTVKISASNNPVCYGTSTFMQAVASSSSSTEFTYVWSRSGNSEYKVTDRRIWPVFYSDETMTVVATDADHKCVSSPATYKMTVQQAPVISNMAKKSYCDGDSVHFILTGANAYYVNNKRISGSDTSFIAPVGTNQYNIYGVAQRGSSTDPTDVCKSKAITEFITVNMKPMVNLKGEQTVCQGSPLNLTAEVINYQDVTGLSYNWSEDQNNNTNKLTSYISTPRTITVKVTDPNGCSGKDEKTYTVYENPKAYIEMPEGDIVCNGSLANLVAVVEPESDAYSYRWTRHTNSNYSETVSQITPNITAEDTFYLNVSDPHGCVSRQVSQLVKVVDKPTISVLGYNQPLCQDSLLTLTFSGADVYYVNNEELVNNVYTEKMTTARTAYYDVVGYINIKSSTNSNVSQCYSDAIQQKVEVNPNPTLVVSGATTICEGSALSLTASGGVKYEWSVADNAAPDDVFELIPSGSVSGKYYYSVAGYSENGCKTVQNVVVSTLKSPSFSINPSSEGVCTDAEVKLTAVPDGGSTDADSWSYSWTGGQLTGATGQTVSTVVTGGNTFTATATNSIGCSSQQKVTIAQYAIPSIEIQAYSDKDKYQAQMDVDANNTVSLCEGSQLKLFALPAANSASVTSWVWDDDAKSAGQIYFPGDTIKNRLTYTHHVIGTTANGCQSDAYINVQISKAPQVAIRANNAACYGTDIELTAMGADSYEWPEFNNATDAVYTTPATTLGVNKYTLYGYSADGCRGVATFNVEVYENPMFSINSEGAYVCAGQQAYVAVEPNNASADYAYSWSNGANTQAISPSYRAAGTIDYKVTVTDQNTGCAVDNIVPITYFANPKLSVANGASNTVCRGSELVLVGEGANEYYWYVGANEYGPYYNDETFTSSPTVSQSYKLYGNNVNDNPITGEQVVCTSSIDYPVTVVNSPSIQILGNSTICYGESVKLSATGIDLNETGNTTPYYYWEKTQTNGAEMTDQFTAESGAEVVYTVKGVSANGCSATKTKAVTMRPKTVIRINAPSPVCEGFVATAKAIGENIVSYRWDTDEVGDSIAHVINSDVTYTVTATDANDCKVSEKATIKMQEKLELVDATVVSPGNAILVNGVYSVCSGNNLTLKVTGASTYMWNNNPDKNASSIILAPVNDTIYTVEGVYGVCKATMTIPVHAIPAPTVSIESDGAVCSGNAIQLSPYSDETGLTYLWSAAATNEVDAATNVLTVHPVVDTKVTLIGSTAEGCRGTATTVIKVNNLPDIKIDGDLEPCVNSYTDLTASGAISYQWTYDGRSINSVAYSALVKDQPTQIKVWGVDANGCKGEITETLTPVARPTFTIDGDLEICANTVLQLQPINDETACTYVWNGKDTTNVFNEFMTKAGNQNMSVVATLKDKPGCSTTKRFTVKVNELPQLYLTGNNYPCEKTTMTVTAHGAEKYIWSHQPDVECTPTAEAGCTYTRNVTSAAPFSVKLSGWKNGCRADSVFTFQVHESPLVRIDADNEQACADGVVTLTASSPEATTYDWGLDGSGKVITPVITETKTFKVTVLDKYGCEGTDEHTIELITSPTLTVYASEDYNSPVEVEEDEVITVCSGSPLSLTARGGKTYHWVDALESSDDDKYTLDNTTVGHRIRLTGYLGTCEASRTLTVKVLATPDPWIDGDTVVCEGDVVSLVANGADHYTWSGVTGVSGDNNEKLDYKLLYKPVDGVLTAWDKDHRCYTNLPFRLSFTEAPELYVATETDVCAGLPLEMTIVNPDSNVVYVWNQNFAGDTFLYHSVVPGVEKVTVEAKKRGIGGCKAVKTYDITTHALPYISFSADGDLVKVSAVDSSITMCSGNNLILVPLGAKHYTWNSEGLDTTANTMILKPTTNSVYTINGVDEYGCENSRDILVKTNPSPVLYSPMYGTPDEDGQINVYVCRKDSIDLDIAGADSYKWYNGTTEQYINVKPDFSRKYVVTGLKSENNCPTTVEYNVIVRELPDVTITDTVGRSGNVDLCIYSKIKIYSNGGDSYIWYDDKDNEISRKDTVISYAGSSTYFKVVATDSNRCVNSTKYNINTIERPVISYETAKPVVCSGERTTLYARSDEANSWTWFLNNYVLSYNSSLTVTPTADANYTLYGQNKYGCGSTINVPLTVSPSPTIWVDGYSTKNGVSDTIEVCKYQELPLRMMGDAETWEWPSGSTDNKMVVESASISQTYQVTGIGANGCKTTIKIPVSVIPTALITITGDQYVCEGQSTTLNAVAKLEDYDNYVWSNNMIGTENKVYIFSDTTISVTGYNSQSGCSNTVSFPIKKKALPNLAVQGETDICKGGSSVIYATGANSYLWHDGSTGDAFVSTPQSNDVYKVIGTLDGCSDSISIPITVRIAPVIWADGLKPICQGEALSLVAQGAETYEWSDGTTTAEFTANPVDDITYTLTGTSNGCSSTIQVPVTVRPRPVVTYEGSTSVCLESATELKAVISSDNTTDDGAGNKYRWYIGDDVISTQNVLNYIIRDPKTLIKLEGIDPAQCSNTVNITVTSVSLPELQVNGPSEICVGSPATYYATGAKEYQWINGGDTVQGNVFKVSPETDTYYTLKAQSAMGCKADTTIFLVVNQLPEISVAGNTSVCRGESLDLVGAGADSYLWSNGETTEHFTATPAASSEYQLTGTDANGCSNSVRFKVTVNELPEFGVRATNDGVCEGSLDTLFAVNDDTENPYTYFWTTADGTNLSGDSIVPVIAKTTVFTVTANNDNTHCQSSVNKTVYAYNNPILSAIGKDSVCLGQSLTLTAVGGDSKEYVWTNKGEVVSTSPTVTLTPTGSTEVYLTGKLASCTATKAFTITVVPLPYPAIAAVDGKEYVCRGSKVDLVGSGLAEAGIYKWAVNGDTVKVDTAEFTTLSQVPSRSSVYSLTAINSFGCVSTADLKIGIQELPVIGIEKSKNYVCPGQVDSVKFAAKSTSKQNIEWSWTSRPGIDDILSNEIASKFTAIIDTTIMVYLHGTDQLGCVGVDSTKITLRERDAFKFRVNPSCIDNDSRKVRFAGLSPESSDTKWTWTVNKNEYSNDNTKLTGSVVNYEYPMPLADSILVGVHAVDPYGCIYDSSAYIYKWHDFWAPEAFSPNGDGLNDRFVFRGGRFIQEFHVIIYDRLGSIVYEGDENDLLRHTSDEIPTNNGWDGTYKGKACPWGVYGYTVTYKSTENSVSKSGKKKGMITLIR